MSTQAVPIHETFLKDIQPLAQIIMLDAAHGDSNVIDICTADLKTDGTYASDSWRRFLIDSGPGHDAVRNNLIRVLKNYKQPKVEGGHAPLEDPRVEMVQFTHTDDDHCGGGKELFETLATDKALQGYFSNTLVAFHRPPKQHPEVQLTFAADLTSTTHPYKVTCMTSGWDDKWLDLEKSNVYLRYNFTINSGATKEYETPVVPITAQELLAGNKLTVKCEVSLYRRHIGRNTTHLAPFNMRAAHKVVFTAEKRFPINNTTGNPLLTAGKPDPLPKLVDVTKDKVPHGERRRAEQMYYRVEEGLEKVLQLDRTRRKRHSGGANVPKRFIKGGVVWVPEQNQKETYGLATMTIVGPTPTIHHELIGDMMRVEYDQGVVKAVKKPNKKATTGKTPKTPKGTKPPPYPPLAEKKNGVLHNMGSIVTLFRRWDKATDAVTPGTTPALSMLFTGDAHDRECQVRDTIIDFAGSIPPRFVNVLKIPHHGSLCSTSVEFYNRITADVYLVCAQQNNNGLPSLRILEAIASGTTLRGSRGPASIFFSNPDSLWNIRSDKDPRGLPSNLNILLSGSKRPGALAGSAGKYDYTCYILKHPETAWTMDTTSDEKNAGIILLGKDKAGKVVVTADPKWWDKWDEQRISKPRQGRDDNLGEYRKKTR